MRIKTIYKCLLKVLLTNHGASYVIRLKSKFRFVYDWIKLNTPKLNDNFSFSTRVCWILNDYTDFPICKYDGKYIKIWLHKNIPATYKYPSYCKEHSHCNEESRNKIKATLSNMPQDHWDKALEKRINTCLSVYGYENVSQVPKIIDKITDSISSHYSVKRYSQTTEWKEQTLSINNTLYGADWYSQTDQYANDISCTLSIKYNGEYTNVFQIPVVKNKIENTKVTKYNDKNYNNRPKFSNTLKNKYGTTNLFSIPEIRQKLNPHYKFKNVVFQSMPELAFYIWLSDNQINFEYQPGIAIPYLDKYNKEHLYHPDFYLPDIDTIVEVKGDNHFNIETGKLKNISNYKLNYIAEAKYDKMIEIGVIILWQSQMTDIFKYITTTYKQNYKKFLNQFRITK